jgi:hypothetical protein
VSGDDVSLGYYIKEYTESLLKYVQQAVRDEYGDGKYTSKSGYHFVVTNKKSFKYSLSMDSDGGLFFEVVGPSRKDHFGYRLNSYQFMTISDIVRTLVMPRIRNV